MTYLILGLIVFLGTHSIRIVADDWRSRTIQRSGALPWKGGVAVLSLLGFGLLVWGFAQARLTPWPLWVPPVGMRHLAAALMLLAFVLLAAAYVPGNAIKAKVHHPMVLAVKVWAFAHLLANGNLAHVLLFGSFLVWAVLNFRAARARDRAAGTVYPSGTMAGTLGTLAIGVAGWAVFAFWAHRAWIGVSPLG